MLFHMQNYITMPTPAPRVSIGLPVYNGAKYLEEAIASVLNQTFTDFELIICDNASTDATEAICRAAAKRDSRIRYERHPENLGAAKNYNSTLARARAPYFRWMCHDDVLAPTCIEACVDVLDTHPDVVLTYTKTQMIDASSTPEPNPDWIRNLHTVDSDPVERFTSYLQSYCWGGEPGPLFGLIRTAILRSTMQHGDFPSADLILIGEFTLWGGIYQVPERLFLNRLHDDNSTRSNDKQIESIWDWFDPNRETRLLWLEMRWLRELHRAIQRAPLSPNDRWRCRLRLMRYYALRHGPQYVREALYFTTARVGLQRSTPPPRVVGLRAVYPLFWETS